ncbi:MAG: ABC transporter substrate-binding protein [Proteobacteria bacterium]|nr:ABC transporter substrate-binding protein [Pseudomonadota bacterium]
MAAANVDWAGVAHPPAGAAPRIASLVPSLTALLFALDLGAHVVARTTFCLHPRERVRRVPRVGGTKDPDLARLRELAPTHLIVNVDENRRDVVDAARGFVPHVIVTHPAEPGANVRLYALFGAVFDRAHEAAVLARDLAAALAAADATIAALPRERVLYLIWRRPWMTVARDTYVGATLSRAGWDVVRVGSDARYPVVADDDAAWRDADRILLSTEPWAFRTRDALALARRTGKPVTLVDGTWTSWYGPHAIAGATALAALRRECVVTAAATAVP